MDLSLVPIDALLDEMEKRTQCIVLSYILIEGGLDEARHYMSGNYYTAVMMASLLNNEVLNNWDGELDTLQKIHNE